MTSRFWKYATVAFLNLILLGITVVLQILKFGTCPKVFANSEQELKTQVDLVIHQLVGGLYWQLSIIGLLAFGMNFLYLKVIEENRILVKSIVISLAYLIIGIVSLHMVAENFRGIQCLGFSE